MSKRFVGSPRDIAPLSMRASIRPDSINADKRTVDLVWTTGAPVLRYSWDEGPFYEELSLDPKHVRMGRLNNGAPLLAVHNSYSLDSVLGVVESARLAGKEGVCTVRFPKADDDPAADKVFRKVLDGIITNVSVGYRVWAFEKTERADEKIPTLRAIDWEPYEISLVPMGADDGAGTRGASAGTNPCELIHRSAPQQERATMTQEEQDAADALAAAERARTEAAAVAARTAAATAAAATAATAATADATAQATRAERERVTTITSIVRTAGLDAAVGERLINENVTLDAARTVVLDAMAARSAATRTDSHVAINLGAEESRDKFMRGAIAAFAQRAGLTEIMARAAKVLQIEPPATDPGEFRGMSLFDMARECLERAGVKTRGMDRMRLIGEAFTFRSVSQSTSDFAVLLENIMHKTLQAEYATAPDTHSDWCGRGTVSDFRAHARYRFGMFGGLDSLTQNGEFKQKPILDAEKATITLGTKGNIIVMSRQMIINDDLGAFTRLPRMLGRAAKLSEEIDAYAMLTANSGFGAKMDDATNVFDASRNNVGVGAAISVASIDADRSIMARQTEPNGKEFLDLRPRVLVVATELGGTARVINGSPFDPDTANKLQRANMVYNLFDKIVATPRLSGNRRYMFADPTIAPVIEKAYLDGQSEPVLETKDGWNQDGAEMRVRHDYAFAAVDFRGGVTNAGQ